MLVDAVGSFLDKTALKSCDIFYCKADQSLVRFCLRMYRTKSFFDSWVLSSPPTLLPNETRLPKLILETAFNIAELSEIACRFTIYER